MSNLGEDFAGYQDADPSLTTVGGRRALLESLARRWSSTRRAMAWAGDELYGDDIREFVGTTTPVAVIAARAERQALLDERVLDARTTVTRVRTAHGSERLQLETLITDATGPFTATMLVSELTVDVISDPQ